MPFDENIIRHIGRPLRRTEDRRLLTGRGRFTDDFSLPGQTWAAMVRSPHPHARILQIDATRARAMPGVLGVFTGRDCADDGLGPIPHNPLPKTRYDLKLSAPGGGPVFEGPHVLLPIDKARHVGEAVAMVVADTKEQALDAAEAVDIVLGDTDIVRLGGCSHSGRSMRHAATVFALAVQDLIERGRRIVAVLLQTAPAAVHFEDGRFRVPGAQRSFDFPELADAAARAELPDDLAGGLAVARDNEMHDPVFPNGCHVCEVEVDPETGQVEITRYAAVDDVGRCINPMIVHGQTHGGIAQGVGQAMWEQCVIDPQSGQPVCGSLLDYAMPRADRFPELKTEIAEVLSPTNPLGIKAGGEGGTTPALAVIVSAVADALRYYGVKDLEMPLTPQKVWQAIRDSKQTPNPVPEPRCSSRRGARSSRGG